MMLVSFPYFIMVGIPGVFNTKTLISKNQELDVGSRISTTFRDRYVSICICRCRCTCRDLSAQNLNENNPILTKILNFEFFQPNTGILHLIRYTVISSYPVSISLC